MARTPSTMLDLGTPAPDFCLPSPRLGTRVCLDDYRGRPLVVVFMCNHCPFVLHILDGMLQFAGEYADKGLQMLGINSNDVSAYPDDSPSRMIVLAEKKQFNFTYVFDETQAVAKAYRAACTPDFYLFDAEMKLVYRGQFDEARPGNDIAVTGKDLRRAADAVLAGDSVPGEQKPSLGCNIKWRPDNAPDYFSN